MNMARTVVLSPSFRQVLAILGSESGKDFGQDLLLSETHPIVEESCSLPCMDHSDSRSIVEDTDVKRRRR